MFRATENYSKETLYQELGDSVSFSVFLTQVTRMYVECVAKSYKMASKGLTYAKVEAIHVNVLNDEKWYIMRAYRFYCESICKLMRRKL